MDRGDHEIEPGEHRLVEVDAAVLEDVGFDTLQHPDAREPSVHLVDLVRLAREVAGLEAAGVRRGLAVVGDADVLVAGRAAGQGELLDRVRAVGVTRVAVEKAAQVAPVEQTRQGVVLGGLDLALALAQLGRNAVEAERRVERGLVGSGDERAPAPERGAAQAEITRGGVRGERAQVRLAPGGLHQHRARVHRGRHHDLRARPAREAEREPAIVLARELMHTRQLAQPLEQLARRDVRHDHEHQIPHHFGTAAHVARHDDLEHARHPLERRPQSFRLVRRVVREPEGARLPQVGDAFEDVLGSLGAEPGQAGQPAIERRRLELRERIDVEHVVDLADLGDAEPLDGEHLDQAGGDLLAELLEHTRPAGGDDLGDDLQRRRAHALGGGQAAVVDPVAEVGRKATDGARRGPEGADAKRILALELEERGDLLQHLGDGLLVHEAADGVGHGGTAESSLASARARQPSSSSSSAPTSENSPAASPPASTGEKSGVPSGRSSPRGRGPAVSTALKPSRSGRSPKMPSTRSSPLAGWTKQPSIGSAASSSMTRAHTCRSSSWA